MIFLIVFLPLLGSIISGFFGNRLGGVVSMSITSALLVISMLMGWVEFFKSQNSELEIRASLQRAAH